MFASTALDSLSTFGHTITLITGARARIASDGVGTLIFGSTGVDVIAFVYIWQNKIKTDRQADRQMLTGSGSIL